MSDTAFGRCANTRLRVCEPFSGMAVERPAAGVGNGEADRTRTAGQDAVIDGAEGTDPVTVSYFGGGRPDRVEVERRARADRERDATVEADGRRWQQRLMGTGDEVQQKQASAGERGTDEHSQHHSQEEGC